MRSTDIPKGNLSELRQRAEKKVGSVKNNISKATIFEIEHELNVHKVELEMQNEELRLTQLMLEKSLEEYSQLFEYAPIGYFILDRNGVIVNQNDAGSKLLGANKTKAIGKPFSIFLSSEFCQDNFYRHRNLVIELEKPQQVECKIQRTDGTIFYALIISSLMKDEHGCFKHFLSIVKDITERKEQEGTFKMALAKEMELNELKSKFITTASHEFRTPLATILLSNELLEKYNNPEDEEIRKKHYCKIRASVQGLTEILVDFLSLNKFEEGQVKNKPEFFNLVRFTNDIAEELNIRKQTIKYRHTGEIEEVYLDPKLLKICLTNLLGNAIKYSDPDRAINITTNIISGNIVTISVMDEGIGIAEDDKPFIFDQFFRAKNAETYQGTGVGLNIVQKFVGVMHGKVSFTSQENKGSTFVMTFDNI